MKTREYVTKYALDKVGVRFNRDTFIADFTNDFMAVLEYQSNTKNWSYSIFKNCVKDIRTKWDNISNKMVGVGLPEGLWKYFYATVIVKARDELFGEYLKQKEDAWRERHEWRRQEEAAFGYEQSFFSDFFSRFMGFLNGLETPTKFFDVLGLTKEATQEEVMGRYREMCLKCHPDKGGSQEEFIRITEAKNKCLAHVSAQERKGAVA